MSDYLLTQLIAHGAPLFGLFLFLGALGVPIGASILVIAAGAFSQQGILDWRFTSVLGLVGCIIGDAVSFGIGYFARDWVDARIANSTTWKNARDTFDSRGGMAVYLTRFLITALAVPTNLIAGGGGMHFRLFMTYDILGEATWIILYGGLGYWFGSEWELLGTFINNFGGVMLGLVILIGGVMLAIRRSKSNAQTSNRLNDQSMK